MGDSLSVDLAGLRAAAAGQNEIAERAMLVAAELKAAIASAGVAWGTDKPGKTFEEFYLPSSEQAVEAIDQMVTALDELGIGLNGTSGAFEAADLDAGNHVARHDPNAWGTVASERTVVPSGFAASAGSPVERPWSVGPDRQGMQPSSEYTEESPGDGRTAASDPDQNRHPGSSDPQHPQLPEGAGPENPVAEQKGQAPVAPPAGPVNLRAPEGKPAEPRAAIRPRSPTSVSPATGTAGQTAATPWSSGSPKDAGGPPSRAVSAPQSPSRAGDAPPPRPMAPRPTPPQRPEQARPGQRQASKPVAGKPEKSRPDTRPHPVPAQATAPEVLRIAREMAARHGLTLVGFETAGIDEHTVRELAAAVDQVLTTHHLLDLRVVEIADSVDGLTAWIRWDPVGGDEDGPVTEAARLFLDRAKVAEPLLEPAGETVDLVHGPVAGPIHAVVIRALGRALDSVGGHAARRRVQRTLIRHFIENIDPQASRNSLGRVTADYRRWRHTLPGAGAGPREFDPAAVLVEAFADVVTGSAPSSSASGPLHRLLVDTAAGTR